MDSATHTAPSRQMLRLSVLFAVLYFIQGIAEPTEGLIAQPVRSLMEQWGKSQTEIGTAMALVALPWSLKLVYGLLTDFVPLFNSRRRGYLLLCSAATVGTLLSLFFFPPHANAMNAFVFLLLIATVGVAFTDVVVDAYMVETGQPLGMTGRFQSVQWTSIYLAGALTGSIGGWLSQHGWHHYSFLICALVTLPTFFLAWFLVKENPVPVVSGDLRSAVNLLIHAVRSPAMWASCAFLFLLNFNPFSSSVLYHRMTVDLGMSEQFYGNCVSIASIGAMVGSAAYGFYCRRVRLDILVHLGIVACVLASLGYWFLNGEISALIISFLTGVALITTTMIQLDVAARSCPPAAAGTVFATLMAVTNLALGLSQMAGGILTDSFNRWMSPAVTFNALVGIGAACTAACWLVVPFLRKHPPSEAAEVS